MRRILAGGPLLVALLLAGCQDDPASRIVAFETANATKPGTEEETDLEALPRFAVELRVDGPLRPGAEVEVSAAARALLPTRDAELSITLPEVEAARSGGEFRLPAGEVPAAAARRTALGAGEEARASARVALPGPGYYRVVASAVQRSDESPAEDRRWVQGTVHRELWLLVDEGGGRVTEEFEPSLLPAGALPAPGPLRLAGSGARRSVAAADGGGGGALAWRFTYYDRDARRYEPVPGAQAEVTYYRRNAQGQAEAYATATLATGADGLLSHPCAGPGGARDGWMEGMVLARSASVRISPAPLGAFRGDFAACGAGVREVTARDDTRAHVFASIMGDLARSAALLGVSRPQLKVTLSPGAPVSYYNTAADHVTIGTGSVWGIWGKFVMAHELGHAVHEKALGGNAARGHCPPVHYLEGAHNLECAYSEGFADFHAAAVRGPELGGIYTFFQANRWYPGLIFDGAGNVVGETSDGSVIEGAVAALLLDLVDDDQNETHDRVSVPGSYVAELVRSCEVRGASWERATGVDHLVHCMEARVDPAVTGAYFRTRAIHPTEQRESAAEPAAWSLADLRTLWKRDLFWE